MRDPHDRVEFGKALYAASIAMGRPLDSATPDVFFEMLKHLAVDDVRAALLRVAKESDFLTVKAVLDAHKKKTALPPYLKRWRDPLALPAMHPRDTWPKEEK